MAAVDPAGGQAYWFGGLPFQGLTRASIDSGGMAYWFGGMPNQYLFPAVVGSIRKTHNGLAIASVKTINGLAVASINTWNGAA